MVKILVPQGYNNVLRCKKILQILPFYSSFIEKPEIKKLSSTQLLQELPFYDQLRVTKKPTAFSGYARSSKIKIADHKDPLVQLEARKLSIKDLFKDLLIELKGFKYQITLAVLLSKVKNDESIEYSAVYFHSTIKTVINSESSLDKSFQEIFYRIDNWINEGSGWIIESIESEYLNIFVYATLFGITYIELPDELKNSMKRLINIKNSDNKCFLWSHVMIIN